MDPFFVKNLLDHRPLGLHPSAEYIVEKQLEEADIIVINKIDLLTPADASALREAAAARWTQAKVMLASAESGEGLQAWMDEVTGRSDSGNTITNVDYDIYAEGEAELGWLNATLALSGTEVDWAQLAEDLMTSLRDQFSAAKIPIAHVKLSLEQADHLLILNLTGTSNEVSVRGGVNSANSIKMTINARVETAPENLAKIVRHEVEAVCKDRVDSKFTTFACLKPGLPTPTYRYTHIANPQLDE